MTADPCFCPGPWLAIDPADRPESPLAREHATGSPGCEYRPNPAPVPNGNPARASIPVPGTPSGRRVLSVNAGTPGHAMAAVAAEIRRRHASGTVTGATLAEPRPDTRVAVVVTSDPERRTYAVTVEGVTR